MAHVRPTISYFAKKKIFNLTHLWSVPPLCTQHWQRAQKTTIHCYWYEYVNSNNRKRNDNEYDGRQISFQNLSTQVDSYLYTRLNHFDKRKKQNSLHSLRVATKSYLKRSHWKRDLGRSLTHTSLKIGIFISSFKIEHYWQFREDLSSFYEINRLFPVYDNVCA